MTKGKNEKKHRSQVMPTRHPRPDVSNKRPEEIVRGASGDNPHKYRNKTMSGPKIHPRYQERKKSRDSNKERREKIRSGEQKQGV